MKKTLILLAIFIATSLQASAQCGDRCDCDRETCCSCCKCGQKDDGNKKHGRRDRGKKHGAYFKDTFNVYYNGEKLPDASANSFEELGHGYARDAFNVYYRGRKIDGASANSFEVVDDGYARDAFNTYYRGKKIN